MQLINIKNIIGLVVLLLGVAATAFGADSAARRDGNIKSPDLPPDCYSLQVEPGNKISFHAYAIGVQIYRWNGSNWDFVAPEANLYADARYHGKIGTHFAGPTWESNSGSAVSGADCDQILQNVLPFERCGKRRQIPGLPGK